MEIEKAMQLVPDLTLDDGIATEDIQEYYSLLGFNSVGYGVAGLIPESARFINLVSTYLYKNLRDDMLNSIELDVDLDRTSNKTGNVFTYTTDMAVDGLFKLRFYFASNGKGKTKVEYLVNNGKRTLKLKDVKEVKKALFAIFTKHNITKDKKPKDVFYNELKTDITASKKQMYNSAVEQQNLAYS